MVQVGRQEVYTDSHTSDQAQHYVDIMLEHMPLGVALYDAQDLRLLTANALMLTFLDANLDPSWRNGRTIGHPVTDWLPEAIAPGLVAICRVVAETGTTYCIDEYTFDSPGRGTTYWKWTLDPVRDSSGRVTQLLQVVSPVTGQVLARQKAEQAHAALRQTNRAVEAERKRLEVIETVARSVRDSLDTESIGRAAVEAISTSFNPIAVHIHVADPVQQALRLLHIHSISGSEETLAFLKYVPYDSPLPVAQAHKGRDPIIIEDMQSAVVSGMIASNHPLATLIKIPSFICVPLWFKDHFEGTLAAIFRGSIHPDGPEVQTLVGCSMHIAAALAHARLHAAVENERARLWAVLDQLPEGVFLTEASDGRISYANAAATDILGVPPTSSIGVRPSRPSQSLPITDLSGQPIPPENFATTRALSGETISGREEIVTRLDGSQVVLLSSAAPLRTERGTITGAVTVFQDITERKSVEQHKNAFLSIASHELRTPITTIQGLAEILQMHLAHGQSLDTPRSLRAITDICEQSQRLTRLIEEMLDISRIENARLLLNLAPHDLLGTLSQVIESQAIISKHHRIPLVLAGLQETDTLIGTFDEDRIVQVVNNLLSNAIKYSPTGGDIEVGLRYTQDRPYEALIWVKDHGVGIAADELPHIFERFFRASNFDRSISGLGIGLYLVNELVTRHGGRVWAESSEGSGSTFFVLLPLNNPP